MARRRAAATPVVEDVHLDEEAREPGLEGGLPGGGVVEDGAGDVPGAGTEDEVSEGAGSDGAEDDEDDEDEPHDDEDVDIALVMSSEAPDELHKSLSDANIAKKIANQKSTTPGAKLMAEQYGTESAYIASSIVMMYYVGARHPEHFVPLNNFPENKSKFDRGVRFRPSDRFFSAPTVAETPEAAGVRGPRERNPLV